MTSLPTFGWSIRGVEKTRADVFPKERRHSVAEAKKGPEKGMGFEQRVDRCASAPPVRALVPASQAGRQESRPSLAAPLRLPIQMLPDPLIALET